VSLFFLLCALVACGGKSANDYVDDALSVNSPKLTQQMIKVNSEVSLELLDFGGKGDLVLLLGGAGDSAHVFEDFAPRLTDSFHVMALTRRGYGASSKPSFGYDTHTLAEDIRAVLDAKGIVRVNLVGHSIAGDEMTRFAGDYPNRVNKLVYLDAAYDRTALATLFEELPFPERPLPTGSDLQSLEAYRSYDSRVRGVTLPVAEYKASMQFFASGAVSGPTTPATISAMHSQGVEVPNYAKVTAPTLAIYAISLKASDLLPWFTPANPDWNVAQEILSTVVAPFLQQQREMFGTQLKNSRQVGIESANHYIYISHAERVAQEIRNFLTSK